MKNTMLEKYIPILLSVLLVSALAVACAGSDTAVQATLTAAPVKATEAPTAEPAPTEAPAEPKFYQLVGKYEVDGEHADRQNGVFMLNLNEDGTAVLDRYRYSANDASDASTNPTYEANLLTGTWKPVEKDGVACLQIKLAHVYEDGTTENEQTVYAEQIGDEYAVEVSYPIVVGMSYMRVVELHGGETVVYADANAMIQANKTVD